MSCYGFTVIFFFFKQKTAYEMRISDWSSDVCSSDLEWRKSAALALDSRDSGAWRCLTTTSRPNSAGSAARMASAPSNMAVASSRRSALLAPRRAEERRVGKETVSTRRSRWAPYHPKQKKTPRTYIAAQRKQQT